MSKTMPELRFKALDKIYNTVALSEVVDKVKSYSLSRDVETEEITGYKYIHYGDIHTKKAAIIEDSNILPNIAVGDYVSLQEGDLVLADASEDYQGIATPSLILNAPKQKLIAGLHTIALRPKNNYSSIYIYYLLYSQSFKKFGYRTGTGMKVFGINYPNLIKFENLYPSSEEQQKIGELFKQLDDTISLQQQLLEQQQQHKKAMLQKMFPQKGESMPKVRFDGFSQSWTELKMGEVFEQTNEYINPQESNLELFSLTVEKGLTQKTARYDREFLVKKADKFKKVGPNEFVYNPMNMTLGAVGFNDYKFSVAVSGYYVTMKIKGKCNNEYFRIVLTSPQAIRLYKLYATGSLIEKQRVQFPTFSEIKIKVPVLEEQQKIGDFFKQIEDTIAFHEKKLEDYQQLKKVLLQRMFV